MPKKKRKSETVITLTLPQTDALTQTATLLIQRGDLAQVKRFDYAHTGDLVAAIEAATGALTALEADPPVVPDAPAEKTIETETADTEPTIDIRLKQGTRTVKMSHIKITGGDTDAAAYRKAHAVAGRLIDGGLWDGTTPIQFDDVKAVAEQVKYLTDKDLRVLFKLEDFVQTVEINES